MTISRGCPRFPLAFCPCLLLKVQAYVHWPTCPGANRAFQRSCLAKWYVARRPRVWLVWVVMVVPLFVSMVRWHLVNTYQGTILIYTGLLLPFSIYLMTNFFKAIPREIIEARPGGLLYTAGQGRPDGFDGQPFSYNPGRCKKDLFMFGPDEG